MEKELIKNELITRCEKISDSIKAGLPKSSKMFGKIHDLATKVGTTDDFSKQITDELNKILTEKKISFQGNEKQELIAFLKPTITELIQRHIKK